MKQELRRVAQSEMELLSRGHSYDACNNPELAPNLEYAHFRSRILMFQPVLYGIGLIFKNQLKLPIIANLTYNFCTPL